MMRVTLGLPLTLLIFIKPVIALLPITGDMSISSSLHRGENHNNLLLMPLTLITLDPI